MGSTVIFGANTHLVMDKITSVQVQICELRNSKIYIIFFQTCQTTCLTTSSSFKSSSSSNSANTSATNSGWFSFMSTGSSSGPPPPNTFFTASTHNSSSQDALRDTNVWMPQSWQLTVLNVDIHWLTLSLDTIYTKYLFLQFYIMCKEMHLPSGGISYQTYSIFSGENEHQKGVRDIQQIAALFFYSKLKHNNFKLLMQYNIYAHKGWKSMIKNMGAQTVLCRTREGEQMCSNKDGGRKQFQTTEEGKY